MPLLVDSQYYQEDIIPAWGGTGNEPPVHRGPKPMVYAGPTFEYYTKLSHFSLGLDLDVIFPIGLDLGASATLFFKYTF